SSTASGPRLHKRESLLVVAEGVAGAAEVDGIMKEVFGINHGVFEMMDSAGLDVALDIENNYVRVRGDMIPPQPFELLKSMVDAGNLGTKSGKGFYDHAPKDHIVFLDVVKGDIRSLSVDGSEGKTLISGLTSLPDGVQIDMRPGKRHIYWTNMGSKDRKANDGFLSRANLNGSDMRTILPPGAKHTPKQLALDTEHELLYWADREGGRIQCCALDGSRLQTLYVSASTPAEYADQRTWCKGGSKAARGRIFRANIVLPAGMDPAARDDVEVLFDGLPEPIDLALHGNRLYWTDRGDPPFGNTLNSADVSSPLAPGAPSRGPSMDLVIAERFHETVGIAIDAAGEKVYVSDLLGTLWVTELDGSNKTAILRDAGNFTGIAFHSAKSA
ncbi:putative 3-hydroxyacyl-CoA dehydrogenase, partial [Mycena pura]